MLNDKIEDDLKQAMKNKDAVKVSTLRFLKAAMLNTKIEKRQELTEEDIIVAIKRQIKERNDSTEEFKKGNRQDLVDKETAELNILKSYLPEELNQEQLLDIVKEAIAEAGATSVKDMGRVMKIAMVKAKGSSDGKTLSAIVNKELCKGVPSAGL